MGRNTVITIDGKVGKVAAFAREAGLPACVVVARLNAGMDKKVALTAPLTDDEKRRLPSKRNYESSPKYSLNGDSRTVQEWSEHPNCVVGVATLRTRLNNGWDLWKAMTTPPSNDRKAKMYTLDGETLPLSKWLRSPRCKATRAAVKDRLARGWDFRAALETPLRSEIIRAEIRRLIKAQPVTPPAPLPKPSPVQIPVPAPLKPWKNGGLEILPPGKEPPPTRTVAETFPVCIATGPRLVKFIQTKEYELIAYRDPQEMGNLVKHIFKTKEARDAYIMGLEESGTPYLEVNDETYSRLTTRTPFDDLIVLVNEAGQLMNSGEIEEARERLRSLRKELLTMRQDY